MSSGWSENMRQCNKIWKSNRIENYMWQLISSCDFEDGIWFCRPSTRQLSLKKKPGPKLFLGTNYISWRRHIYSILILSSTISTVQCWAEVIIYKIINMMSIMIIGLTHLTRTGPVTESFGGMMMLRLPLLFSEAASLHYCSVKQLVCPPAQWSFSVKKIAQRKFHWERYHIP